MKKIPGYLKNLIFGKKINETRVVPIGTKIIIFFITFIFVSNLATNYFNLSLNSSELTKYLKELLIKDMNELYNYSKYQYELFNFNKDKDKAVANLEKKALRDFDEEKQKSLAIGVYEDGSFLFQAFKKRSQFIFADKKALDLMRNNRNNNIKEGFINFKFNRDNYFGVYKYSPQWNAFIIRAEELNEFYGESNNIFITIILIILGITLFSAVIGMFLIQYILRFVNIISNEIMKMVKNQKLEIINLKKASNDNVTFLGMSLNSLSSTINNLMNIFLKFVNQDIAQKAYRDKTVRLEGEKKELTVLFSDIRSFTFMTETLGIDIIKLLNLHYENVINDVIEHNGVIGSIIGDALLAVFGIFEEQDGNKSIHAIRSAYEIQDLTARLRDSMKKVKERVEKRKGGLTPLEKLVYKAVLIEIGVGLDGGTVFYGTLGSTARMTNTVIGDNVNSASRLEALTKIYKLPVICSEYIRTDVESNVQNHGIRFVEIDRVRVKGKTIGKIIYWPIFEKNITRGLNRQILLFSQALQLYYDGDWKKAGGNFRKCRLPFTEIFIERTKKDCPKEWDGIWEMETK